VRVTIRSSVPISYLRSRIHTPFEHLPGEGDIGMVMSSALDVRAAESRAAYRAFHEDWNMRVEKEAKVLCELGADLVFSNVGYLPLAGAQLAGIPNMALCSLNWFDIYRHYCGDDSIAAQIHTCYAHADAFLRATPGMVMETLPNLVPISPIAAIGDNRRDELVHHLRLSREERLVLVTLGGIASRLSVERWPRVDGVRWLVQQNWKVEHPDAIVLESLPVSFSDLMASCDALLCKPGYGSFVEAACSGTPVLYVDRPDWPESSVLIDWMQQHGVCGEVSRLQLESGLLSDDLSALWTTPKIIPPTPGGATQVVDLLMRRLSLSGN
jgi:hypothetical protein